MSYVHQREVAIFDAAQELPPEQREAYLEQTCGNDQELIQRVRLLLNADEKQTDFLVPASNTAVSSAPSEKPGDRIGPYKLLQLIGEGGCGVVYMAEQDKPIHRRVALKIIKLGMDTKQVIARFEAERQALALMDHPNIAKVHDAGATATGRPYFVMELVRGVKITDYCDDKKLTTRQRLELFIQVCQAVQHAHQKGIIHRDLKPSNILVTVNDGVAVAKVIDFGIAKATTGERLTDKTLFTAFEQFIGTPAYVSPEQAEITSLDVDTRSDIYSLGVLLYELLTGQTPFDARELVEAGLDGMRRTLREKEPARPSTRLSTLGYEERTDAATRRGLEAPKLVSSLRGDLDWIVMKCLEKDRARRYETASGLAMDIERHLNNEPVVASPPSGLYRFRKLVQRNKLTFAAVTGVTVSLLIGLGISTWMFLRERAARREAVAAERRALLGEKKAQTAGSKSQQVASFLIQMLQVAGPSRDTAALRKFLDDSTELLRTGLKNQPETEADLLLIIGEIYLKLAEFDKAEVAQRRGLELRREAFGVTNAAVAESLTEVARVLARAGGADRLREAEAMLQEALQMERNLLGSGDAEMGRTMALLAGVLSAEESLPESEALWREVLDFRCRLLGHEHPDTAGAIGGLAMVLAKLGRLEEAETRIREALEMERRLMGDDCVDVSTTLENLGRILRRRNKLAQAEDAYRKAFTLTQKLFGENVYTHNRRLALADVLREEGKLPDAQLLAEEALAICDHHPDWSVRQRDQAVHVLAAVLADVGDFCQLESLQFKEAEKRLARLRRQAEAGDPGSLNDLAWMLATCPEPSCRDGKGAVACGEKSVARSNRTNSTYLATLAAAYAEAGDFGKAAALEKEAMLLISTERERGDHASRLRLYESSTPYREGP